MIIHCTKKLLEKIKIEPVQVPEDENPLYSWHANLIKIPGFGNTVVLTNDNNRYVLVLSGLKSNDFKKLDYHIMQAISATFKGEYIKPEVIEKFLENAGKITYAKTKNRSLIARMNKSCEIVHFEVNSINKNSIIQPETGIVLSKSMMGGSDKDYIFPNEKMYENLEEMFVEKIFDTHAAELLVTLDLEKIQIKRKILVHPNITFFKLHLVIQAVFGWQNYHLHSFFIYGNEMADIRFINHPAYHKDGIKPEISIFCDQDVIFNDDKFVKTTLPEKGRKLSDYLPAKIKYLYDYGDNWCHYIDFIRIIEDYENCLPICIEGEGKTPPEDVGGVLGYEEFLEIISDENHPEYENYKNWANSLGYKDFDIEEINDKLKRKFSNKFLY